MQVKKQEIDAVEEKLNQQHGIKAAVAAALWAAPVLVLWYWIYQINGNFAPLMLALSGAVIGTAVRFHGRGYTPSFSVVAFVTHLAIVVAAFLLGMSLGEGQSVLAVMLAGLYAAGAWAAAFIGRVSIPFSQQKAFFLLTEQEQHASSRRVRNRWFLMVPVSVLLCCITLSVSLVALTGVDLFKASEAHYLSEKKQRSSLEQKAMDVTSESLQTLSDEEAMRHAYAFFNGYLPGKRGYGYSRYPKSEYKAKRILSFLSEERGLARAQYVLGRLSVDDGGGALIQQAADNGDVYANVHLATEFGCYGNTERATELLNLLAKTLNDARVSEEIDSILYTGFHRVCAELSQPDFAMMYLAD